MRRVALFLVVLVLSLALLQGVRAEDVIITEKVRIERSVEGNTTPLNLTDPNTLYSVSPQKCFWEDVGLNDFGVLVESPLPPDLINTTDPHNVTIEGYFILDDEMIADGAAVFQLRLPVAFDWRKEWNGLYYDVFTELYVKLYEGEDKVASYTFYGPTLAGAAPSKYVQKTITYLGRNLTLNYVMLYGYLRPDTLYKLSVQVVWAENITLLLNAFDTFQDGITDVYVDGEKMEGDLSIGFRILDATSAGVGAVLVQSGMEQNISVGASYSGLYYVSLALNAYATSSGTLTITVTTDADAASFSVTLSKGFATILGSVQVNFGGGSWVKISYSSDTTVYLVTDGKSTRPLSFADTKGKYEFYSFYYRIWQEVGVSSSDYYVAGAIVVPGDFLTALTEYVTHGSIVYLPVRVLVAGAAATMYTTIRVYNFIADVQAEIYRALEGSIEGLISAASEAFSWFVENVVEKIIDAVSWWTWMLVRLLTLIAELFVYSMNAYIWMALVNGFVALVREGPRRMYEEFSGPVEVAIGAFKALLKGVRR